MTIAEWTYHLATNETFQAQFLANPKAVLASAGLDLTGEALETLSQLPWQDLLSRQAWHDIGIDIPGWYGAQFSQCPSV